MQVSLTTLAEIAALHGLDYELVVVEWNPPPDAAHIRDLIEIPAGARGRVRFMEVTPEVHRRLQSLESMPFCEYIGKNAAIRRSRGDWVLACTPDVIFSENLVRFLAKARLRGNAFYRIDRCDVADELPLEMSWRERLRFCDAATRWVQTRNGPMPATGLSPPRSPRTPRALSFVTGVGPWAASRIDNSQLHTNASGDFLLMSRDDWFRLRGYTELCTHGHIDSIMCWTASTAGLDQILLDGNMRLYHQEHDRSRHHLFPQTDLESWRQKYEDFLQRRIPLIFNDETWGLVGQTLPETIL